MAKRKVSDFLLREEGMVGNRSAFATAALVSMTALAMTLLVTPDADAGDCGGFNNCDLRYCCTRDWENYLCVNNHVNGRTCWWA
jgi:hypothetical protein